MFLTLSFSNTGCVQLSAMTRDFLWFVVRRMSAALRLFLAARFCAPAHRLEPGLRFLPSGFCRRDAVRCALLAVLSAFCMRFITLRGGAPPYPRCAAMAWICGVVSS